MIQNQREALKCGNWQERLGEEVSSAWFSTRRNTFWKFKCLYILNLWWKT